MGGEGLLHLDGIDVLPAGDDHLVVATDHEQPAGRVEVSHVPRGHETVVEVLGGTRGVSVEQRRAAHEDLADLSVGHLAVVGGEDAQLGTVGGSARGVRRRAQVCGGGGGDHARFGGVVVVVDDVAELVHEGGDHVRAHPRARRGGESKRLGAVPVSHVVG